MQNGLSKQNSILETRRTLLVGLPSGDEALRSQIDRRMLEQLRAASPEGLKPLLFQRNNQDWTPGFLVAEVGRGGRRILVLAESWKLLRAKRSAKIRFIPSFCNGTFSELVQLHAKFRTNSAQLLQNLSGKKKLRKANSA